MSEGHICEVAARYARMNERQASTILDYRKKLREVEEAFTSWGLRTMLDAEFITTMKKILAHEGEKPMLANTPFAEVAQGQAKGSPPVQSV